MADKRTPAVAAAIVVAVLAAVALALGPPQAEPQGWMTGDGEAVPQPDITRDVEDSPEPMRSPEAEEPGTESDSSWFWPLLAVLMAMALAWLVYRFRKLVPSILRRRRRRRTIEHDLDEAVEPDFTAAAHEARRFLTRSTVPGHEAVISAWLTLEAAAAESGVPRGAAHTPSEFTARLLATQHADPDATHRLLELYHRARFAADPRLSEADVTAAATALDTIIDSLATPPDPAAGPVEPVEGATSPNARGTR